MKEARWKVLLRKSISACVAAIEVYNKPVMPHRDETFAMLAVNAWELMLKARLVREAGNDLRAIQVFVPVLMKDGQPTKRRQIERNRAGNPMTISLGRPCTVSRTWRRCHSTKRASRTSALLSRFATTRFIS